MPWKEWLYFDMDRSLAVSSIQSAGGDLAERRINVVEQMVLTVSTSSINAGKSF
jgi:hypothetical protein